MKQVKYEDTDRFVVTRRFLEDPRSIMRDLFEDEQ
jgi:hypothetical protein